MLTPTEAHKRLTATPDRLGFDDPTAAAGPPVRWYWHRTATGHVLARSGWRDAAPVVYDSLTRPRPA